MISAIKEYQAFLLHQQNAVGNLPFHSMYYFEQKEYPKHNDDAQSFLEETEMRNARKGLDRIAMHYVDDADQEAIVQLVNKHPNMQEALGRLKMRYTPVEIAELLSIGEALGNGAFRQAETAYKVLQWMQDALKPEPKPLEPPTESASSGRFSIADWGQEQKNEPGRIMYKVMPTFDFPEEEEAANLRHEFYQSLLRHDYTSAQELEEKLDRLRAVIRQKREAAKSPEQREREAHIAKEKQIGAFLVNDKQQEEALLRKKAQLIRDEITALKNRDALAVLADVLGKELIDQLMQPARVQRPCTLRIDSKFRILLSEYDIEIKMNALPKALYILFLRHPEGIDRMRLDEHKEELRNIYLTISNRTYVPYMNSSIDDLVEPGSTSLNEKISRINAAFRGQLAADMAERFIVAGPRGEKKRVLAAETAELPEELRF